MDLTLLVLAAGRSTRYGRLKQTDPVGPSGETIVDYSVSDALRAGFTRVVFVLRTDIEQEFRDAVGRRIETQADVRYAFQDRFGPQRAKPWGTVHAVLAAQDEIGGPFGVVNADDFYGPGSYRVLAGHLGSDRADAALVGFALRNTLSESGGVTRGICRFGTGHSLTTVDETFDIVPDGAGGATGSTGPLSGDEVVSMNMWGFRPSAFGPLHGRWEEFLAAHGDDPGAELTIPPAVTDMITRGELDVTVLPTGDRWFGVTHPDDRPLVVARLRELVDGGGYPAALWGRGVTGLVDRPAVELAGLLHAGELSARELLGACLERIGAVNPAANAIVTLDAEGATAAAAAADERFARSGPDGPLHGLPVVHKDTHMTAGMRTTWGSPLMADHVPDTDELAVARIAAAGAIRLGKSNVPEWAAGSHTVNPVFGVTHNAHRHGLSAGGSSGGAAVALALGMVPLADGSDMGGSLRNPASLNGVVGFRPTPGRVPAHPSVLPYQTLAVQGPLGRTVADAALLLSVMAGPDPRAPLSLSEPGPVFAPPLGADVSGLRVAWAPDLGGRVPVEPAVSGVVASAVGVFDAMGAHVETACPDLGPADDVFTTLRAYQFLLGFGVLAEQYPDQVKATIRQNVDVGRRLTVADLGRAATAQGVLHRTVVEFFERYDVLVCPTVQVEPFDVGTEYPTEVAGVRQPDYLGWMRSCTLISATGCPAVSVPAGFSDGGLPVGLQIVGPPRADRRVLEIASGYENAAGVDRRRLVS